MSVSVQHKLRREEALKRNPNSVDAPVLPTHTQCTHTHRGVHAVQTRAADGVVGAGGAPLMERGTAPA